MAATAERSGLGEGERVVEGGSEEPGSGNRSGFGRDGLPLSGGARTRERERERVREYVLISHTHTHSSHPIHSVRIKQATDADVVLDDADVHVFVTLIFGGSYETDFEQG